MHQLCGEKITQINQLKELLLFQNALQCFTCMSVRRLGSTRPELPVKKHKFLRSNPRFATFDMARPYLTSCVLGGGRAVHSGQILCPADGSLSPGWAQVSSPSNLLVPSALVLCEAAAFKPDLLLHLPPFFHKAQFH